MKFTAFVLAAIVATASAAKKKPKPLPGSFELRRGGAIYDCVRRAENAEEEDERMMFKYEKLKKWVAPNRNETDSCKFDTFRCKIEGGECMTRRRCMAQGPKYKWVKSLCSKKIIDETFKIADVLEKHFEGEKFNRPKLKKIGLCGCCKRPEGGSGEAEECGWGCAPADYSSCPCAPPSQAGCEAHEDKTGDKVCAWDGSSWLVSSVHLKFPFSFCSTTLSF